MKQILFSGCLLFLVSTGALAQRERSALLPASEVKAVVNQCSRPSPTEFTGTWAPSKEELTEMESRFAEIRKLTVLECCIQGEKIKDPERFFMQYAGIVLGGKKLIYINAIPGDPGDFWKEKAVVICDGGTAWGVLYDPMTKKFSSLAVNGIA